MRLNGPSSSYNNRNSTTQGHRRTLASQSGSSTLPHWQHTTPAVLKEAEEFGDSFVDNKRRQRFSRGPSSLGTGRAQSEIKDVINPNYRRMHNSSLRPRADRYHDSYEPVRSQSFYDRQSNDAQRVAHHVGNDWMRVDPRDTREYRNGTSEEDDDDYDDYDSEEQELANINRHRDFDYSRERSSHRFTEDDLYYFGVIRLSPHKARQTVADHVPPEAFWTLSAIEKTAYLYYFELYNRYITPVEKFHAVFNREFYKYKANNVDDVNALLRIVQHTKEEYDAKRNAMRREAYDRSRRKLFSDDRATPDSRASASICEPLDESDLASIDSGAKEPRLFSKPHAFSRFSAGGRLVLLDPAYSISTIRIEDAKSRIPDRATRRNVEAMEVFKGPLIIGETASHTPLLFIERQIQRIQNSEIFRQNPSSSDANDVLLIWRLLEMLIRQHGNVTGPDLARLLTNPAERVVRPVRGKYEKEQLAHDATSGYGVRDERRVDSRAVERYTSFLLGGYIDEAIESAIDDGLLFDALILAHRMYGRDNPKLEQVEMKLLKFRDPQNPALTLLSVASEMPVPILSNMCASDDTSSWRGHIAIVLANLNTQSAMITVHQLGLALSRKEFNAAADFCFLAVHLLTSHNSFAPSEEDENREDEEPYRRYVTLINASLPDDEYYSTRTPFGWSITDLQATEIYDFALKMSQRQVVSGPSFSPEYQKCRFEYAQLLTEYGGSATAAFKYCADIANCVSRNNSLLDANTLIMMCDLADNLHSVANQTPEQLTWIPGFRRLAAELFCQQTAMQPFTGFADMSSQIAPNNESFAMQENSLEGPLVLPPVGNDKFATSTPSSKEEAVITTATSPERIASSHYYQHEQTPPSATVNNSTTFVMPQAPAPAMPPMPPQPHSPVHQEGFNFGSVTASPPSSRQQTASPAHSIVSNATLPPANDFSSFHTAPFVQTQPQPQPPPQPPSEFGGFDSRRTSVSNHIGFGPPQPSVPIPIAQRERTTSQSSSHQSPVGSPKWASFTPIVPSPRPSIEEMPAPSFPVAPSPTSQQQQHQHPPVVQQRQAAPPPVAKPAPTPVPASSEPKKAQQPIGQKQQNNQQGGLFSGFTTRLRKMIPSSNDMILPDDSNPSIQWDANLGRWVGEGVEEPVAPPPPPMIPVAAAAPTPSSTDAIGGPPPTSRQGGLRRPATSRYVNSFASSTAPAPAPAVGMPENFAPPSIPSPPTFTGFMPTPAPDDGEYVNPFSEGPSVPQPEGASG